ncbi:MAG TPA: TerB family tellurite resistance protein [Kofleriaceae bacterium]
MNEKVAKCLLVAKVLVADGIMTDDERHFLDAVMAAEGLDAAERHRVTELDGWDEAERLVRGLPIEQRRALIEQLVDAASADGRLSAHELATIRALSAELGVV